MKPRNWRTYYWYRPPSLECPPKTDEQCRAMAQSYVAWLVEARGWTEEAAQAHIDAMDRRTIIAADHGPEVKSYERKVTWITGEIAVRTVPCFSREPHFATSDARHKSRSEGVTVHWVMVAGRQVDSFLTAARAMERAKELSRRIAAE